MNYKHLIVLAGAFLVASLPAAVVAAPPKVEDFVRQATYSSAKISPTGEFLAMTVERGEQDVLTVLRTKDLSVVKVNQLPDEKSVGRFEWVNDNRLVFNSIRKVGR